jgi:hypothetical protein
MEMCAIKMFAQSTNQSIICFFYFLFYFLHLFLFVFAVELATLDMALFFTSLWNYASPYEEPYVCTVHGVSNIGRGS